MAAASRSPAPAIPPHPAPIPSDPSFSYETSPALYLFTSLTAGSSHITTASSRMQTILRANRIPYYGIDLATDERARRLWTRRCQGKKIPGLVKAGSVIADLETVEEWNEFGEIGMHLGGPKKPAQAQAPKENVKPAQAASSTAAATPPAAAPAMPTSANLPIRTKEAPSDSRNTAIAPATPPSTSTEKPPEPSKPAGQSSLASEVAAAALKRKQDKAAGIARPKAGVDVSKIRPLAVPGEAKEGAVTSPSAEQPPAPPPTAAGDTPKEAATVSEEVDELPKDSSGETSAEADAEEALEKGAVLDEGPVEDALDVGPALSSGLAAVTSDPKASETMSEDKSQDESQATAKDQAPKTETLAMDISEADKSEDNTAKEEQIAEEASTGETALQDNAPEAKSAERKEPEAAGMDPDAVVMATTDTIASGGEQHEAESKKIADSVEKLTEATVPSAESAEIPTASSTVSETRALDNEQEAAPAGVDETKATPEAGAAQRVGQDDEVEVLSDFKPADSAVEHESRDDERQETEANEAQDATASSQGNEQEPAPAVSSETPSAETSLPQESSNKPVDELEQSTKPDNQMADKVMVPAAEDDEYDPFRPVDIPKSKPVPAKNEVSSLQTKKSEATEDAAKSEEAGIGASDGSKAKDAAEASASVGD